MVTKSVSVLLDDGSGRVEPLYMGSCILDRLGYSDTDRIQLSFRFDQTASTITLAPVDTHCKDPAILVTEHAHECPGRSLKSDNAILQQVLSQKAPVRLGVVVLLQNDQDQILLTRRAKTLSTFPGAWVLPGGHIDANESLEDGAAREVLEETGLNISTDGLKPFALWESFYPPLLYMDLPRRQHIVMFFRARVHDASTLKLQPEEVDAVAWLSATQLAQALCSDGPDDLFEAIVPTPSSGSNAESDEERSFTLTRQPMSFNCLYGSALNQFGGGIAHGHRFGLREWTAQARSRTSAL
eukprot:GILK01010438.1.p1 GENE.GILK01010438.1~~GILK01010438.1.p1  ORF type:complete len:298 (+),score=36.60 GILK01010438.1:42-935(+)